MDPDAPPESAHHDDEAGAWRRVDDHYAAALAIEDDALTFARLSAADTTMPHAAVSPAQGAFLALLVKMIGAARALEIGTLAGYSTIWLARAMGPGGRLVTVESEEENARIASRNIDRADVGAQVDVCLGTGIDWMAWLINDRTAPFDFIFIDADRANYPHYLSLALKLTQPGSVIVLDNMVRQGRMLDADTEDPEIAGIRKAADIVAVHPQLEASVVQTVGVKGWDGFLIARRI